MGNNSSRGITYEQYYQSLKQTNPSGIVNITQQEMQDLDPYEVFGLSKNYTWDELKNAYRRVAKLVHPDKGGSEILFRNVTECFRKLALEFKNKESDKTHDVLKKESQQYFKNNDSAVKSMAENAKVYKNDTGFMDKFNKAFEENRLEDEEFEKGYGHMMTPSSKNRDDINVKRTLKKYTNESFNKVFEETTLPQTKEVIKYVEPEAMPMGKKIQYTELGGKTDDFSSTQEGSGRESKNTLQYTDYMRAYTQTRLVDPRAVSERESYNSVDDYNKKREKLMGIGPTQEEIAWRKQQEEKTNAMYEERLRRLTEQDKRIENHYHRVHNLLR